MDSEARQKIKGAALEALGELMHGMSDAGVRRVADELKAILRLCEAYAPEITD